MVYFNDYKVYTHYMQIILKRLQEYELHINLKKSSFYITSINFLGFIVSINKVLIEKSQVDTIREWPYPIIFREV